MLQFFPLVGWLAAATSLVLLALLHLSGDITPGYSVACAGCLLFAAYLQFFVLSPIVAAAGLTLQTLLAIYLTVRWRLAE